MRGIAADVDDQRDLPGGETLVVMHGGGRGLFEERHAIEARDGRGLANDRHGLFRAFVAHRTAEMHGPADHRGAHRRAELAAGREADVLEDVRGDVHDHLAHLRIQPVAEHRLRRFDEVAVAVLEIGVDGLLAEQRVLETLDRGGGRFGRAALHPLTADGTQRVAAQVVLGPLREGTALLLRLGGELALLRACRADLAFDLRFELGGELEVVRIGHHLREEHRRSELLGIPEMDVRELVADEGRGGGIARAEIDTDVHGALGGRVGRMAREGVASRGEPASLTPQNP
jgi:hypothetical protein